jgi:hypothetical protein
MNEMHWTFRDDKTRVADPDHYFGFVYLITNKKNQRKYVGCKQYWQMRHRKRYKPSNWKVYTSSSKELCADIEKIGKRNFKFEIIQEYTTKRGLHYYEQYYQMKYHVLTAVLEGTDQKEYYNKNVGGIRFYCPVETYEDPARGRAISSSNSKGPYRITFDTGKEIIIDSLNGWAKSNGYSQGNLSHMSRGKPEFHKLHGKDYKFKRTKHKDIVKVERIGENPSDMGE